MKRLMFGAFMCLFISLVACHKHKEDTNPSYVINFSWVKPKAADEVWTLNQAQKVEVKLKRNDNSTVHYGKLIVTDSKDVLVEEIFNGHLHKTRENTISEDYTPKKVGSYKFVVSSTDDAGNQENKQSITFTVK